MNKTTRGKKICGYLKGVRKKIAEENDIKLDIPECTYEGECRGTCPRCEWEVRYIEQSLFERVKLGKIATISGIAIGLSTCVGGCGPVIQTTGKMSNDRETSLSESVPEPTSFEDTLKVVEEEGIVIDNPTKDSLIQITPDDEIVGVAPMYDEELSKIEAEKAIYLSVEEMPEFRGGADSLYVFLDKNIRYPQYAKDNKIQGNVFVQFVVEKDGTITNPKVLRDIGGGCGEESLRLLSIMPKWKPGKLRGKTVRVQYKLPISFRLKE